MKHFSKILLTLSLCATAGLRAGQTDFGGGNVTARWLNLSTSTRGLAMGGGTGALGGSLDDLGVNPAGLGGLKEAQATFGHSLLAEETSLDHLAVGYAPMQGLG